MLISILDSAALTPAMVCVLALLALAVVLFAFEILRLDVAALLILILLGLSTLIPGLQMRLKPDDLLNGFSSNAVLSIVAVMIISAGLARTGIMYRLADSILRLGRGRDRRTLTLLTASAGLVSSFMPNVGAVALFLPVVSRITTRMQRPMRQWAMPMAFCVMLGGNMTIVGSSSLILLNDLIQSSNRMLPPSHQAYTFSLFAVAPVGLCLLLAGIAFFALFGRRLLPAPASTATATWGGRTAEYFKRVYGIEAEIYEIHVPEHSRLIGRSIRVAERAGRVRIVAARIRGENRIAPAADHLIEPDAVLGILAGPQAVQYFINRYDLELRPQMRTFAEALMHTRSGVCEVVIPPDSDLIGKTIVETRFRPTYGLAVLAIHRGDTTTNTGIRDLPLRAGDTLICHTTWDNLALLERDRNFVVVTSEYPREKLRQHKVWHALICFLFALALALFTQLPLALALLTGAVGMILSNVLTVDEAYQAVSWRTVFLLAGLIPLGHAMETTGTAAWVAGHTLANLQNVPAWVLEAALAVLATGFTLVMSNVGATVLLVPLAMNIAQVTAIDPSLCALTVGLATSNSFLLPTHQANALIIGPGNYRVSDFLRVGGLVTVLYLVVMLTALNLLL